MINFDFLTLSEFLKENSEFFIGARLQKIQQPTRLELVFGVRNQGETRKFYININPNNFHLCFMSAENEKKRFLEIPKSPPMFCMLLRKYLEGARIAKVNQPQNERILEFYFETYNELSEKIYICLAIELMGKHSNVVLYNYDTNVIIGCMHNVGAEKSSVREIIGGLPYTYPPVRSNKIVSGFSQLLKKDCSVNETIDNYFANLIEQDKIKNLKSRLLSLTKTKLKKVATTCEKLEKQSKTQEKMDFYRKKGDLIMANLFHNNDFSESIEVMDYETNSTLKIELDEAKTLKENANQFYKLYNKAKTANLKTEEMWQNLAQQREYLEQVLYSIEVAEFLADLLEIDEEWQDKKGKQVLSLRGVSRANDAAIQKKNARGWIASSVTSFPSRNDTKDIKSKNLASFPFTFHISHFTIYVGKNNKQNDYIVSKLARDEDLWFHIHNSAGSHVLLRVESGQIPTEEIIFECAKLAKQYSRGKDSSKVGVIYTKAKNLKKPPGANLGYVIYKGEKEIIV